MKNQETSGVIQSTSEGLRTTRAEDISLSPKAQEPGPFGGGSPSSSLKAQEHQHPRAGEMDVPAQAERANSPFLQLFVLFRPSAGWTLPPRPLRGGRSSLLSLLIQMLISSRNRLPDTPRNNVLQVTGASVSSVRLMWQVKHTSLHPVPLPARLPFQAQLMNDSTREPSSTSTCVRTAVLAAT